MGIRVIKAGGTHFSTRRNIKGQEHDDVGNLHIAIDGYESGEGGHVWIERFVHAHNGIFGLVPMADYDVKPGERAGHGTERPLPVGLTIEGN